MTQSLLKPVANTPEPHIQAPLTPAMTSFEIFTDKDDYLDTNRLFYAYFGKVPSSKSISDVECARIRKWMETAKISVNVINTHSREQYSQVKKRMTYKNIIYILNNDLLLSLEGDSAEVIYACGNEHLAQDLINGLKTFAKREKLATGISIIISAHSFLSTISVKIKKPKLNIDTHYNDDLGPIHNRILDNLKKKNTKGLFLFYGVPGTGKSTYIRFLIHHLRKKVIFVPPSLALDLESPQFSLLLIENKNAVLIIEDAEELIVSRDGRNNSKVSALLNLSDGLLAESFGIQVIASFNTNITNVDKALLRKGRLTSLYEFNALSQHKSEALLKIIGFPGYRVTNPMTLAEIYNLEEIACQLKPGKSGIGFNRSTETG